MLQYQFSEALLHRHSRLVEGAGAGAVLESPLLELCSLLALLPLPLPLRQWLQRRRLRDVAGVAALQPYQW